MQLVSRRFWLCAAVGHSLAAGAAGVLLARGFPLTHPRFWVNQFLPPLIVLACASALWAGWQGRQVLVQWIVAALAGAWIGGAIAGVCLFPVSARLKGLLAFVIGCMILASVVKPWRPSIIAACVVGALVGVFVTYAQRAPPAATYPLNAAPRVFEAEPSSRSLARWS
jgi:hypothetical protein